ncbi:MAG: RNA polymerase sigma factor [Proteobacteria bacterium]|nr:RNA polymerase sigma factor [Pseudomonadota bacterium]
MDSDETRKAPAEAEGGRDDEARWRDGMVAGQAGDQAVYQKLLEGLLPVVQRLVKARLANATMADDVVQNALLSIHRARHTYRPERPFGPWMRTIVRNACIDALRQSGRRQEREVSVDAELPAPRDGWGAVSAQERLERAELSPELERALDALPVRQREAVEWLHVEGLSVAEAALRAGASPGAIKVRAHRGYRALRLHLEKERR